MVWYIPRILDDMEMYEQQEPFKLSDFVTVSYFLNQFLYKAVLNNLFDIKSVSVNPLFASLHTLLMAIYRRDCRRCFCPEGHWLAKLSTLNFILSFMSSYTTMVHP
ncbi:hypothetical protein KM043_015746 [Ampulex compressa]|nr:hypothetical protein KM043_015746 [Ampulex compressa]